MKTRNIVFSFGLAASAALMAEPKVSEVTFAQPDQSSRRVKITYRLENEPAIVTVDIHTNGVSIGDKNLTCFAGAVNRVVEAGQGHTVYWYPDLAWPGHKVDSATAVVTAWATNAPPNYMVLDLIDGDRTYYTSTNCLPEGGLTNDLYRTDKMVFRKIPARGVTWRMGSPTDEYGRSEDEKPHLVMLTKDYWFGIFSVTMAQHKRAIDDNSEVAPAQCFFTNLASYATRPFQGAGPKTLFGSYIPAFQAKAGGMMFTAPTEAQWEYAARAGTGAALTTGRNLNVLTTDPQLNELGRYDRNCGSPDKNSETAEIRANDDSTGTSKVGIYKPNRWGIYDVHGSVHNICRDRYGEYEGDMKSVQENPTGADPETASDFVARGGTWGFRGNNGASFCRLSSRRIIGNDTSKAVLYRHFGYRLCLEIE